MRKLCIGACLVLAMGTLWAQQKPLVVGVDGTFAPHAMPKLGGGVEGFNIDLVTEAGRRMGRKVEIFAAEFSGLIPAMQSGKIDFVGAPTTVTPERAKAAALHRGLPQHLLPVRGGGGQARAQVARRAERQGGRLEQGLGLRQVAAGQRREARPERRRVLRHQRRRHAGGDLRPRRCRALRQHDGGVRGSALEQAAEARAPEGRPGPGVGRRVPQGRRRPRATLSRRPSSA